MDTIHGFIERITFQSAESGFTVAQLQQAGHSDLTCIVGTMPTLQPGETVRCTGTWKRHLIHGMQFEVKEYHLEAPADILGIQKYLGSGLVKGIGPAYAKRIVERFGLSTLDIIDTTPKRLKEVEGIGDKRIKLIQSCWEEQKTIRDVMVFLQSHGVTPTFAQKIFKRFGNSSVAIVTDNPYTLARELRGVGFKTADGLAEKLGVAKDSPKRIDAGIEYVLSELSDEGHVCFPEDDFLNEAEKILEVPTGLIQERLVNSQKEERVIRESHVDNGSLRPFVWLKSLYLAEKGIARELQRLKKAACPLRTIDTEKALVWVQSQLNIELAKQQHQAVALSMSEKVQIITGGPGTGKSTITKAILTITDKLTKKIVLCAPTGRAAKRMHEITGWPASTIHSLLQFDFASGGFKKNKSDPIDCDLLIVDESSMIDTSLMYSLLKAVPGHARLLLVGDINQLPSVGPGNVLKDIINSKAVAVTQLHEIFRQAAGSRIITNAHRINNGVFPDIATIQNSDFFFVEAEEPEDVLKQIVGLVTQRIPKKFGFDPLKDIQVLAPMKRGVVGTENLNDVLQAELNKRDNPLIRFGKKFIVGDKVMQLRNDYKREVFNGDVGTVSKIQPSDQQLIVDFEGRGVIYDFSDLDDLVLAYAVSIHKYQGSECQCVVMPVHTTHFKLLHRNLLYTGVTRGKKLVVLVGTKKALSIAVRNDEVKKRYTGLFSALVDQHTASLGLTL